MTFPENTGQIQLSQPFGQWISKYASDSRFQRYLEIGTWNGRGSTVCFYKGFMDRTQPAILQSYEIDRLRAAEAQTVWKDIPSIRILHGRVLKDDQCPMYREVNKLFPEMSEAWHTADIQNFWSCPYIAPEDPEVVLLDGAEYLTQFEFERVFVSNPRIRVYLLDDTCAEKTKRISQFLLQHPEWTRVAYSDTERNGWAVFERINASAAQIPETLSAQEQ